MEPRIPGKFWGMALVVMVLNVAFWGGLLYGAYRFALYQGWVR